MAIKKLSAGPFLQMSEAAPVLDVRSPSEYGHAHIPGAYSLPLFTDDERRIVGTLYKQQSREAAIKAGLDFFGPKMKAVVESAEKICADFKETRGKTVQDKTLLIHCWRGGMRSAAIAWLLDLYGFSIYTLEGGYKKFRHFILDSFQQPHLFNVLGGFTGSGKTHVLRQLRKSGQVVIDLEALAGHKGSAFGAIGSPPQPSQEMFENKLGMALTHARQIIEKKKEIYSEIYPSIWIEDESQRIGDVNIPITLWNTLTASPLFFMQVPFEQRLGHIVKEYQHLDTGKMINAIVRIRKRLGGLETKTAVNALIEGRVNDSFSVLLKYYDTYYEKALAAKGLDENKIRKISFDEVDILFNANRILQLAPVAAT